MQNYAGMVASVLATQFTDPVVASSEEETGKAQLTRAAAWAIHQQDPSVGLCSKTSGNQVAGLSVDTIVDRAGFLVDIATSTPEAPGYVRILPGWFQYTHNPQDAAKWTQPTQALAVMPGPMPRAGVEPGPGPGPGPGPEPADDVILAALEDITATQAVHTELLEQVRAQAAANTARITQTDDANTDKILGEINRLSEEFQATAKKALAVWLASQTRPPIDPADAESLVARVLEQVRAERQGHDAV